MLHKKLPRNSRVEKTLLSGRKWSNSTKVELIFLCSMIRNHVQWVCWVKSSTKITSTTGMYWRFENLQWPWLTEQLWQYHVPHQILLPRFEEKAWSRNWNAAKYTRRYEYPWKRFSLSTCLTRSCWITQWFKKFWRHYWVIWEQKELKKVKAKNHCSQHLYLVLR